MKSKIREYVRKLQEREELKGRVKDYEGEMYINDIDKYIELMNKDTSHGDNIEEIIEFRSFLKKYSEDLVESEYNKSAINPDYIIGDDIDLLNCKILTFEELYDKKIKMLNNIDEQENKN